MGNKYYVWNNVGKNYTMMNYMPKTFPKGEEIFSIEEIGEDLRLLVKNINFQKCSRKKYIFYARKVINMINTNEKFKHNVRLKLFVKFLKICIRHKKYPKMIPHKNKNSIFCAYVLCKINNSLKFLPTLYKNSMVYLPFNNGMIKTPYFFRVKDIRKLRRYALEITLAYKAFKENEDEFFAEIYKVHKYKINARFKQMKNYIISSIYYIKYKKSYRVRKFNHRHFARTYSQGYVLKFLFKLREIKKNGIYQHAFDFQILFTERWGTKAIHILVNNGYAYYDGETLTLRYNPKMNLALQEAGMFLNNDLPENGWKMVKPPRKRYKESV